MNLIVAVDENWGIGYKGDLLIKISEDLKYFKKITLNQNVVMGQITFESLPNKKPLKNRTNIVLTNDKNFFSEDIIICYGIPQVLDYVKNSDKETFIIGGESIYRQFIPYCTKAYITKIYHSFKADKHIPNFVDSKEWNLVEKSEIFETEEKVNYQFLVYDKIN